MQSHRLSVMFIGNLAAVLVASRCEDAVSTLDAATGEVPYRRTNVAPPEELSAHRLFRVA
jgi:hypothetical protein